MHLQQQDAAGAAGTGGVGGHEKQGQASQTQRPKPADAAATGAALNPFAQEFRPGAPSSGVADPAWAQKGLLPAPARGRKGKGLICHMCPALASCK